MAQYAQMVEVDKTWTLRYSVIFRRDVRCNALVKNSPVMKQVKAQHVLHRGVSLPQIKGMSRTRIVDHGLIRDYMKSQSEQISFGTI